MSEWHVLMAKILKEEERALLWRRIQLLAVLVAGVFVTLVAGDDAWMLQVPAVLAWMLFDGWLAGRESACRLRIDELNQRIGALCERQALNEEKGDG